MITAGNDKIKRGVFNGVPEHVETRLYPTEIQLLEQLAAEAKCSRENMLKKITLSQARGGAAEPRSRWSRIRRFLFGGADLSGSVILVTTYSLHEREQLMEYRRRCPYVGTAFALPRHALISELRDRGLVPATTSLPGSYSERVL